MLRSFLEIIFHGELNFLLIVIKFCAHNNGCHLNEIRYKERSKQRTKQTVARMSRGVWTRQLRASRSLMRRRREGAGGGGEECGRGEQ